MTASTARMRDLLPTTRGPEVRAYRRFGAIRPCRRRAAVLARPVRGLPGPRAGDRLGLDGDVGEVELGAAAGAERVVELRDAPAVRALAAQLVGLDAVAERGEQPEERHDAG